MKKEGKQRRLRKQSFRRIFIRYFLWIGICLSVLFCAGAYLGMELYAKQYQLAQNKMIQKFNNSVSEIAGASEDSFHQEEWLAELNANMIQEQSLFKITSFLYRMDNGAEIAATTDRPYMIELPGGEKNSRYYIAGESYSELIEEIERNKAECQYNAQSDFDVKVEGIYVDGSSFYFGNVFLNLSEKNGEMISTRERDLTPSSSRIDECRYISAKDAHLKGPYYADARITEKNRNYLERHYDVSEKILSGQFDGYASIVDSHLFRDSYVITCSPVSYSQNMGTEFCMVNVYHYNLWQRCALFVAGAAVIIFLIILLSAYFFSYRHYMLQKVQWEMLSYRRNIINIMAHDLRTPLTAISGYAENIMNASNPEKNENYLQNIVDNVQYMNELIQHVLVLSGEVDSRQPHIEQVELADVTKELVRRYAGQAEEKNIRIHQSGTCSLSVNATWFHSVLKNLIGNAIGHGKEGSIVSISMDSDSYTIVNTIQPESDSGNNMKGMGLAIIKEILEYYGYQIQLSETDHVFTVRLLFANQERKGSHMKNIIVDEEMKTVYADYKNLSKKELALVEDYKKKGYSLVRKKPDEVFMAPHNMGIHPKSL